MHSTTGLLPGKAVSFHQDLLCTAGPQVCCQLKQSVFTKFIMHSTTTCLLSAKAGQFSPRLIMHSMTGLLSVKAVSFHQDLLCTAGPHVCCQLSSQFSPRYMHNTTTFQLSTKAVGLHQDLSCTAGQHVCCQLKQSVITKIYHVQQDNMSVVS